MEEEVGILAVINDLLFTIVPMLALLCNIFLLFTLITARKDSSIYAFMGLLVSFILWTSGSLFMRMNLYPGIEFWWKVSITGVFLVPFMYYMVASTYTEQKGFFLKIIWGVITVIISALNLMDVFLDNPHINIVNGEAFFHYTTKWTSVFPVVYAIAVFVSIYFVIRKSIKKDEMPVRYLMPLIVGVFIMLVGVLLDTVPFMNTLPNDTLACAVNSGLVYYAFYKKRLYALTQMTSKGAVYIISLITTGIMLAPFSGAAEKFIERYYAEYSLNSTIIIALVCSGFAIAFFLLLNKLCEGLFVKEQIRKEDQVHNFSVAINSSLKLNEILNLFYDLVKSEIPAEHIYICMDSPKMNAYVSDEPLGCLERSVSISKTNPLIRKLEEQNGGMLYVDFVKSTAYRGMWEDEKHELEDLNAEYILPFKNENQVVGFAIFSNKIGGRPYSYSEINFLESVVSVADIAIKNAQLYQKMEIEARLDSLTGVFNRRALIQRMEETFAAKTISPITLILFNLDDFSLYNELYGSEEGDSMLKRFSGILKMVFGSKGMIARYGGKEFAVFLPYCDGLTAKHYADRVKSELAERIDKSHENTKKFLTFSAGICTYPSVAGSLNQLVSYASMAIFQVKQSGKNQIAIYDSCSDYQHSGNEKHAHMKELPSTIYALTAAIDAKDHYTFNHSQCVSIYATQLAELAGLANDHVEIIRQAGLLHDIGKIGIPDAILTKTGKLTNEEFSIMRKHVERSIEMIRHLPSMDYVIPAVIGHHERYDGSGYPRGIVGEDIPVGARCLAIADSFDAMVSRRSYKDKMLVDDALHEISRNLGKQFDPSLGRMFVDNVLNGNIEVIGY